MLDEVLVIVLPTVLIRRRPRSLQVQLADSTQVKPAADCEAKRLVSPGYTRQEVAPTQGRGRSSPTK